MELYTLNAARPQVTSFHMDLMLFLFCFFFLEKQAFRDAIRIQYTIGTFVDFCIRIFLNKVFQPRKAVTTVPKKQHVVLLPFLGLLSLQIRLST